MLNMQTERPLIVDLDGTILRSDVLVESAFSFLRHNPLQAFRPVIWLARGKANLKARLADAVDVDATSLPYDDGVISFLQNQKTAGRPMVLATASHKKYAEAIGSHLGLFDRVLATNGSTNLSAKKKRDLLVAEYGEKGFDYLGNSQDDLDVWASAHTAHIANPEMGVERAAKRLGNVAQVIRTPGRPVRAWVKQLRVHQWSKNALIFVPLLASHRLAELDLLLTGFLALFLFSLCASSVYLLNDLLDLEDDRKHASKRHRPLASGAIPIKAALIAFPALLVTAFTASALLMPLKFTAALAAYYCLTLAYSFALKRVMTVDVIVLAMLYTVRIVAGTFAFEVALTFWMLAFSMFLFLSLAMVKRYTELRELRSRGRTELSGGRGYYPSDLEMISSLGAASGLLSVMVLALYIQDQNTQALYRYPEIIWLACPVLLYWIARTWMVAHRGWMHDDPVVFAIKDRNSLLAAVIFGAIFWFAA